jgi:hypothetical protein
MTKVDHVAKIGRRTVDEYHLIDGTGTVLATSHCVNVASDRWTIVEGGIWRGLVSGRVNVDAALRKLAT